jgi:hypothetical protein
MRSTTDLNKLRAACLGRLRRIRRIFSKVSGLPAEEASLPIAFSIIELDNLVMATIREFTMSTLRKARTAQGHRISVNGTFCQEGEISAFMLSIVQTYVYNQMGNPASVDRKKEPKIRDPRDTEKILLACNASNINSLQNALSLNTTLFSDLATLRNFYAHRNIDTSRKVRNRARSLGLFNLPHPDGFAIHLLPNRPVSIFDDWLDDAELFFSELTE